MTGPLVLHPSAWVLDGHTPGCLGRSCSGRASGGPLWYWLQAARPGNCVLPCFDMHKNPGRSVISVLGNVAAREGLPNYAPCSRCLCTQMSQPLALTLAQVLDAGNREKVLPWLRSAHAASLPTRPSALSPEWTAVCFRLPGSGFAFGVTGSGLRPALAPRLCRFSHGFEAWAFLTVVRLRFWWSVYAAAQ